MKFFWSFIPLMAMLVCACSPTQATTLTNVPQAAGVLLGGASITAENSSELEILATLEGHTDKITSVIFSNDGAYIASSSRDKTIKLWDAQTRELLHTFDAGTSELDINGIVFSPDSHFLITPLAIWSVETYESVITLNRSGLHVAVSPDGALIAVNGAHQPIRLYDAASGEVLRTIAGSAEDNTFSLVFSPDGMLLAGSCSYGIVKFWDVASGELVKTLDYGDRSDVHDLDFSPDGATLATGGTAHSMRLWDVASGQTIKSTSAEGVMGLAFSPDGSLVAAACAFTVKIWDVANGQIVGGLRHSAELLAVAISADGSLIAAGAYDGNIYLWGVSQ